MANLHHTESDQHEYQCYITLAQNWLAQNPIICIEDLFQRIEEAEKKYENGFIITIQEPIDYLSVSLRQTTFESLSQVNELRSQLENWIHKVENDQAEIDQAMTSVRAQRDQTLKKIEQASSNVALLNNVFSAQYASKLAKNQAAITNATKRKAQFEKEVEVLTKRSIKNKSDLAACAEKSKLMMYIPKNLEKLRTLALQFSEEIQNLSREPTNRQSIRSRPKKHDHQRKKTILLLVFLLSIALFVFLFFFF